jgi:hypothetical protein
MKPTDDRVVRCAIYTRVSTDSGLDQEFNSLDAQYDASQAYIRSQAHAGWSLVKARYDDGGFPADRPTALPCSDCWRISGPARSMSLWSTRSIG